LSLPDNKIHEQVNLADETEVKAIEIWSKFLEIIKSNLSELKYSTWFKPLKPKAFADGKLTILVPSRDFYEMIVSRFGDKIRSAVDAVIGDNAKLIYEIDETFYNSSEEEEEKNSQVSLVQQVRPLVRISPLDDRSPFRQVSYIKPEYTFDNFVKGKNNDFAYAASMSISNRPGTQYNPLLIYGGVGLGKTHLLQAIINQLTSVNPNCKATYIPSNEFTANYINSLQNKTINELEKYYKSQDILIVDDVQFFEGKDSTQDLFFQIFNALYQFKKQIVLSCDKPPHQLVGLEERLITRFQWGLTVDIQPPDFETRVAILYKKCDSENITVPGDVIEFIALHIKHSIRSLEGCLKNIIFESQAFHIPIDIDMAKRSVVKFGIVKNMKQNLDISTIISVVSKFFEIDEALLRLKSKRQEIVLARHTAMFLAKELTGSSLQTIGAHFGGRNHATVIHACKCIEDESGRSQSFNDKVQKIKETLLTG
jgi:chromosomal replication initiator protein